MSAEPSYSVISAAAQPENHATRIVHHRSLLRYSPAVFALVILIANAVQVADPDLWNHIRFGQAMIGERTSVAALLGERLPREDVYSYSAPDAQWHDPEWLTEILMASVYDHWGVVGIKCWKLVLVGATLSFLMLALIETGASPAVQLNLLMLAALAMMQQMQLRPQLFTFGMLAAILAILARETYLGMAPLWPIPFMMIVWSNLHGGYIVGLAAIGTYTGMAVVQDLLSGAGNHRRPRLMTLSIAATGSTLVTPYGVEGWKAILHSVSDQSIRRAIVEWQPLWRAMAHQWHDSALGEFNYLLVLGFMVAVAVTFIARPRLDDLPMIGIALLMSLGAFISARNMPLAVLACAIPIASRISSPRAKGKQNETPTDTSAPERSGVNQWLVIAIAVFLLFEAGMFSKRLNAGMDIPSGAVAFMKEHDLQGNVLNEYGWGAYLIWHITPGSKIFIDGRCETVYPDRVLSDYLQFYFDFTRAGAVLHDYPHDFILIPPNAPIVRSLEKNADWKVIYHDRATLLLARSNSPAAQIPGVPVEGIAPRRSYFP
jgi:hypothetical protein